MSHPVLARFHSFDQWAFNIAGGFFDLFNDDLQAWLTDETPDEENHRGHDPAVPPLVNLEQIGFGFGYSGPISIQSSTSVPSGNLFELSGEPILIVATGGNIGPFRYVVLENADRVVGGAPIVISYWDFGQTIAIFNGGSFEILWEGIQGTGRVLQITT